jgi:glycosyltransferase involved in cell wall biosynthesis
MSERITAVVPVKDGARYLGDLLGALERERVDEVLVVDSGSSDGSREIAHAAGATVIEIDPQAFAHGRRRQRVPYPGRHARARLARRGA